MLGVSGTPVLDAVGKLGDLGDRLSDKCTLCDSDSWTDDPADRVVGRMRLLYICGTTLRSDGDYSLRGFPCVWIPTIRFGMAVDAIAFHTLPACLPTVRLVFPWFLAYCTPLRGLTDGPDLPLDGPVLIVDLGRRLGAPS